VEGAFLWVMVAAVGVGIVIAIALLFIGGSGYDSIGRGSFGLDGHEQQRGPEPGSAAASAEADAEIRQMLEARNARRAARGEETVDVERELAALTQPAAASEDPEILEEVRALVAARNARRIARGQEPLDVESEIARQLRDLPG